jgi:hypothetical protein
MKRFHKVCGWTAPALIGTIVLVTGQVRATVLLNDTWTDSSRTETNLPDESAVYVSHPNTEASPGRAVISPGAFTYDVDTASTTRLHTYLAPQGSPASVNVGEQLIATIDFTTGTLINSTSRNFRVGLFSHPSNVHVNVDGAGDTGGAGDPWNNAQGYAAFMFLTGSPGTTQLFQIGKRTASGSGNLMGSTGDYTQAASGGGIAAAASNTAYSLVITMDRVAIDQMNVTYTLSSGESILATQTVVDHLDGGSSNLGAGAPYTSFDMLAFRFSGTGAGVGEDITFNRFHVQLVPEPASMAVLALSCLTLLRRRRA